MATKIIFADGARTFELSLKDDSFSLRRLDPETRVFSKNGGALIPPLDSPVTHSDNTSSRS